MTEYTPSTEQVRQLYANSMDPEGFDRWLAQVKADAWDEGFEGGYFHGAHLKPRPTNPYRKETT